MKREIKFRAWGDDVMHTHEDIFKYWSYADLVSDWDDGYKIMQYTGLKDKNGKEIYEGDIIKDRDGELIEYKSYNELIYLIMYSEDHSGVWGRTQREIEVIGNIYENPELL